MGEKVPSNKIEMKLEDAAQHAREFLDAIDEMERATIAGSIRRRRPIVHDVDIVFDPDISRAIFLSDTNRIACHPLVAVSKWGNKLAAITWHGIPIDLYFSEPETFNTLLLIRTGSVQNNIRLATIAKRKGWKLHASGEGLFDEKGERIAGDSERSIYDALGEPWQEPWERER
jgi:DNA polymerase/3'-5' exonuclease PolX